MSSFFPLRRTLLEPLPSSFHSSPSPTPLQNDFLFGNEELEIRAVLPFIRGLLFHFFFFFFFDKIRQKEKLPKTVLAPVSRREHKERETEEAIEESEEGG